MMCWLVRLSVLHAAPMPVGETTRAVTHPYSRTLTHSYTHLQVTQQLIDAGGRLVQHHVNVPHACGCSKRAPGACSKHHVRVTTVEALQVLQLAGRADSSQGAAHGDLWGRQSKQALSSCPSPSRYAHNCTGSCWRRSHCSGEAMGSTLATTGGGAMVETFL